MTTAADVVVVGAGLIGLASSLAAAERGHRVVLFTDVRRGEASPAAAGMLAPSVEPAEGSAHRFAVMARDRYPSYLGWLAERTGVQVPLNRLGILEVALDGGQEERLRSKATRAAWLDAGALRELEPPLAHAVGALHHADDGAVNNLVLMRALKTALARHDRVTVIAEPVTEVQFTDSEAVATTSLGRRVASGQLVLAAGAWASHIAGLPRPLPIEPVRGQMLSLAADPLRHVVYGADGYLVPRGDGRTLVGATMEHVAFDAETTMGGLDRVRAAGTALCPPLATARLLNGWAGLRPVTPDFQPIIGRDPDEPSLIYACGHSRNGVLMAPLTGDCGAALLAREQPSADLSAFGVERFD